MREYLPVLIVGAIIGAFTVAFILAYAALRRQKEEKDKERIMSDSELIKRINIFKENCKERKISVTNARDGHPSSQESYWLV